MAYMSQEKKKQIETNLKPLLKQYGVKGSLRVRNHSTLMLTIREGNIDFFSDYQIKGRDSGYIDVNPYHYDRHFTGLSLEFLTKVIDIMNGGNWDKSDVMTDYFNVGWYVDVNIGMWNKPYQLSRIPAGV